MRIVMDSSCGAHPKRGDILQTNVGDKRERTCIILHARKIARRDNITPIGKLAARFHIWCERWWEMEPDFRMRLYLSAQRNGGQQVIFFKRYKLKKKRSRLPFFP